MEKKLRVANIGMQFGMSHVEGAMQYGAEIAAICDNNEENLRAAGERYGIPEDRRLTDYMDIVRDPSIDVVTVAVPTSSTRSCRAICCAQANTSCAKSRWR